MTQRCGGRFSIIEWCKRPTQAFRWNLCGWGGGEGVVGNFFFYLSSILLIFLDREGVAS